MALNFPSSPVNGQAYQNWIYDSAKGAWEAKPLAGQVATPSSVAPLSPNPGDMWYNTNDGGVYVYYNDGNTSQWVQMKSDATLSSTLGTRTTDLENKLGLSRVIPPTVAVSGGSASANAQGLVTFTGVTSISLNGVFSSAYDSYRIIVRHPTATAAGELQFRLRAAGVDNTTTNYSRQIFLIRSNNTTGSASNILNYYPFGGYVSSSGNAGYQTIDIFGTGLAQAKTLNHLGHANDTSSAYTLISSAYINVTTATDGFTLLASSGNVTGTIQVFGYNN